MNKIAFLFISTLMLLVAVFAGMGSVDMGIQVGFSLFFIALIGIPHGAIDHVLAMDESSLNYFQFYGFYLGLMAAYILVWLLFPMWSLVFFLLISAYHFGQSQFSELIRIPRFLSKVLYMSWGTSILSGMVHYNRVEILSISESSPDLLQLIGAFHPEIYAILLPVSTAVTLGILLWAVVKKQLSIERFFNELYVFGLIHFGFFVLPLIVGFTLYFITLHSLKVLTEEFTYLKERRKNFSIKSFIQLLLPFTLLSVVGSGILVIFSNTGWIPASNVLIFFILISILTLPHSIVMDGFYHKFFRK
jgi:Brp/Blh family beta-carotene 15,15'-monooxygenase